MLLFWTWVIRTNLFPLLFGCMVIWNFVSSDRGYPSIRYLKGRVYVHGVLPSQTRPAIESSGVPLLRLRGRLPASAENGWFTASSSDPYPVSLFRLLPPFISLTPFCPAYRPPSPHVLCMPTPTKAPATTRTPRRFPGKFLVSS